MKNSKREEKLRRKKLIEQVYSERKYEPGEEISVRKNGLGRIPTRRRSSTRTNRDAARQEVIEVDYQTYMRRLYQQVRDSNL